LPGLWSLAGFFSLGDPRDCRLSSAPAKVYNIGFYESTITYRYILAKNDEIDESRDYSIDPRPGFSVVVLKLVPKCSALLMKEISARIRVTRLGEFSPIGRSFYLGIFSKNYRISASFCATLFLGKILPKNWVGYILSDFFQELML
jgi:hypothetical protein